MMAIHNETGKMGELLAHEYFQSKGYRIIKTNWRKQYLEVDIIAVRKGVLHFIEVKTKTNSKYGYPEEEVTLNKMRYLISAAEAYLFEYPQWERIQFDILSIILRPTLSFYLIEDVYL
jgi:putative endonuclease